MCTDVFDIVISSTLKVDLIAGFRRRSSTSHRYITRRKLGRTSRIVRAGRSCSRRSVVAVDMDLISHICHMVIPPAFLTRAVY